MNNKFKLLSEKSLDILDKPNPKRTLVELFELLSRSIPIDGILISFACPPFDFLPQCYLISSHGMEFTGSILPVDRYHSFYFRMQANIDKTALHRKNNKYHVLSYLNDMAIQDKITLKERAHLFLSFEIEKENLGIFRFLGKESNCFNDEHEELLVSLKNSLSIILTKLYKSKEVQEFFTENNLQNMKSPRAPSYDVKNIVTNSQNMYELIESIYRLSDTDESVLILGETGTGKELIADAIQASSIRKDKPFIKVNCGAIPENLIDSTLFGHEKGAFTGADKSTPGKFEQAHEGTLFLDELGELPLSAQVRLLRVLQDYQIDRVGSTKPIHVNVRIIAATNKDLKKMVENNTFREDLFYRINTFRLNIPPLRERKEDIELLCKYFIEKITKKMSLPPATIDDKSIQKLLDYHWPGNIRELENTIRCALVLDVERELDPAKYIYHAEKKASTTDIEFEEKAIISEVSLKEEAREFKHLDTLIEEHILAALKICRGQIHGEKGAAKMLGLQSDTLRKKVIKLGLKDKI